MFLFIYFVECTLEPASFTWLKTKCYKLEACLRAETFASLAIFSVFCHLQVSSCNEREKSSFCKFLTFLTCLKLWNFFPHKSFFLQKFLLLKYIYSLWRRLLSYNHYNSLLGTTLFKRSSEWTKESILRLAIKACIFLNKVFSDEKKRYDFEPKPVLL